MKKCPYCAEMIQPEAKWCRWCQKKLTGPGFTIGSILRRASFVLLLVAGVSFFLPFVRVDFPMVGTRSLSGFEVVLQLADGRKPETQKKEDGKFTIDVRLLQKMMGSDAGTRVFESRPQYLLIPIGLIGGALAYCLLILIAFGLWIKKSYVASGAAAICFLLTLQLITSLFLLNDLLQTTIAASFASSRDNPFADLMKNFMQGMKIEPDMAVYLLGGAAFLIAMIVWYQPANRDLHG